VIEAAAASQSAAWAAKESDEITEDCQPGCCRLAARRHRGGARSDQRSGFRPARRRTCVRQTELRM